MARSEKNPVERRELKENLKGVPIMRIWGPSVVTCRMSQTLQVAFIPWNEQKKVK